MAGRERVQTLSAFVSFPSKKSKPSNVLRTLVALSLLRTPVATLGHETSEGRPVILLGLVPLELAVSQHDLCSGLSCTQLVL